MVCTFIFTLDILQLKTFYGEINHVCCVQMTFYKDLDYI
jgi:hypothetical protein